MKQRKVIFCVPTIKRPFDVCLNALEASIPLIKDAGWDDFMVSEVGNPYISNARISMLRKALDQLPDAIVFIDHDVAWDAPDLLKLIETKGDVVAGTYRFTHDDQKNVEFMGTVLLGETGKPIVREDGCVQMETVPAGFLKITPDAVDIFMEKRPDLIIGPRYHQNVDLFNHGAHDRQWWGEDYAFCRNWNDIGGEVWCVPNLNITHHRVDKDGGITRYPGNFHEYLLRQKGGKLEGKAYEWDKTC